MVLAQQWQVRGGNRPLSGLQHTVEKHNTAYTVYIVCHSMALPYSRDYLEKHPERVSTHWGEMQ